MPRLPLMLCAVLALTGCGEARLNAPAPTAAAQVASGWTATAVRTAGTSATHPALVERATGGLALAYGTAKLGDRHVYVTTSPDGEAWSPPVLVAKGSTTDEAPTLFEDAQGALHLIFSSNRERAFALYEATSTDGKAWSDATVLTDDDACYRPAATATPTGAALAYETLGHGLRVRTRTGSGAWSTPVAVCNEGGDVALAADAEGLLHLAYEAQGRIQHRTRNAAGTWSAAEALTEGRETLAPALAIAPTGPWLLFTESGDASKICEQTPGARALEARITTGTTDDTAPAALVARDGTYLAAWTSSEGRAGGTLYVARRR